MRTVEVEDDVFERLVLLGRDDASVSDTIRNLVGPGAGTARELLKRLEAMGPPSAARLRDLDEIQAWREDQRAIDLQRDPWKE